MTAARSRLVLRGSGGHARVCADVLTDLGSYELVGWTGPVSSHVTDDWLPHLGTDTELPRLLTSGVTHAFVALGDNRLRHSKLAEATAIGFRLEPALSPAATIAASARIGAGAIVMAGAVINAGAVISEGAIVNTGATVDHDCRIGPAAHVAPGVNLAGRVLIGAGALLGVGSCATPGMRVGEWSVVGAGAAVVSDIPAHATAVGVPARVIEPVPTARTPS